MKRTKLIYLGLGVTLILVGMILFGIDKYWDGQVLNKVAESLNSKSTDLNLSVNSNSSALDTESSLLDFEDYIVEPVADDQILQGITEYKNAIEIPSVGIAAQINEGIDTKSLHSGVGRFPDSAKVGEFGNFAICGHASTTYRCIFNRLKDVKLYDQIFVYDASGTEYVYTVTSFNVVQANDWYVVASDSNSTKKEMTIVTCTDNGHRRFIVKAEILSDEDLQSLISKQLDTNLGVLAQYNSDIIIDNLYGYFNQESSFDLKHYTTIPIVHRNRYNTRYVLFSPVLGESVLIKEHKLPSDFKISLGYIN